MEALALDLKGRLDGHAIARIHLAAFSALKTFDPPVQALEGTLVDDVTRHGKFLDIEASGLHLIFHLARAGWIRWKDEQPPVPPRPNSKSGLAVRVVLDDQSGLDVTEAGTKKSLAAYVVRSPQDVPGIASPRSRPARRRVHPRDPGQHPRGRRPLADQGRPAPPGHDRRHRQRLQRRDPARREDVTVQAGQQPDRRRARPAVRSASRTSSATPSSGRAVFPRASSRARRRPTWRCTAAPARSARCAATSSARSASPTRRCSTAPPARPAASRWQIAGCPACSSSAEMRLGAGWWNGAMDIPTAAVSGVPGPTARRAAGARRP